MYIISQSCPGFQKSLQNRNLQTTLTLKYFVTARIIPVGTSIYYGNNVCFNKMFVCMHWRKHALSPYVIIS